MERITLSKKQKKLLTEIAEGIYNSCSDDDRADIYVLMELDLVHGTKVIGGNVIAIRLTDHGLAYMRLNPKLKNPTIWQDKKYIINTVISLIAMIVSIIALVKK